MIAINIMRFAGQIHFRIQILIKEQTWIRIKITWIRNPIPALQYKFAKSCLQSQLWIRIYICINVKIWIQIPDLNFTDPEHSFFDCSTSLLRVVYKANVGSGYIFISRLKSVSGSRIIPIQIQTHFSVCSTSLLKVVYKANSGSGYIFISMLKSGSGSRIKTTRI